ncbi:T9SS type A sorting domain-containing protein [Hymenobacter arizonensis]|uniref:Por secretion system C-terminal sorting domain-containing protein n=1 Tax=Hymenobacter arizonensis TaxID=1227077 RepID=A0A1I5Z0F5_HYMAR|nr:T9SS type A sorting domain-containing protein [Hymenobacter arizonensis]SFQ49909.1 Por secretion system C-terminal sorting domain-containing protein [Hymenobacter arizonensis]
MKRIAPYFLTLALLVLLVASATAESLSGGPHPRKHWPANPEITAYHRANIQPVLQQQRQKLEAQLDPADRTQLTAYRTQLKALREQGKALRQAPATPPADGSNRPALTDVQREQRQQLHSQTKGIMLNVAQLAQKYEVPIQQLAKEVEPQKEKWAADLKALATKNATPEQQERMAAHGGRMRHHGAHRFFAPARFLLMDPNAPTAATSERNLGGTSFYPNPATATSQLDYDVKKAGPVTVELLDSKGNKLRTLVATTEQEKGPHTQQLDLRDLPAGTYFYKIITKAGSETKRFVKE